MYVVNGTTIKMTRGDTVIIQVSINRDGTAYTPVAGDKIRFAAKHTKFNSKNTQFTDLNPVIEKTIPYDTMVLRLDPNDTKGLEFGNYTYDIQITFEDGVVDTFIAEAQLVLLPEVE